MMGVTGSMYPAFSRLRAQALVYRRFARLSEWMHRGVLLEPAPERFMVWTGRFGEVPHHLPNPPGLAPPVS